MLLVASQLHKPLLSASTASVCHVIKLSHELSLENCLSPAGIGLKEKLWLTDLEDLRDSSTTPLNFTKSINLALSERGINSMRQAECDGLLEDVLRETIPMHARMIHGRRKNNDIYEESQEYDANGRVSPDISQSAKRFLISHSSFEP